MSAESSILWETNDTGDGISTGYTQAQIIEWQRMLGHWDSAVDGIAANYLNKLAVTTTADARVLQTATGGALVYGFPYFNSAVTTKGLTQVVVDTTGWRLVLRAGWAAQTVRVTLLQSADGVVGIPAATQTANTTWDLTLATGTITTGDVISITDARNYLTPDIEINTAQIANYNVTAAKIDTATITGAKIAADTITSGNLAEPSVSTIKIENYAITAAKIDTATITGAKIAADTITSGNLAEPSVGTAEIESYAVTVIKVDTGAIVTAKLADYAVTAIKVDTNAITNAKMADDAIDAAEIADNAVGIAAIGTMVPGFLGRQGGSATNWSTSGTTDYTSGINVRMQAGVGLSSDANPGLLTVTFPVAFSNVPIVMLTLQDAGLGATSVRLETPTASNFSCETAGARGYVHWLAIGPE